MSNSFTNRSTNHISIMFPMCRSKNDRRSRHALPKVSVSVESKSNKPHDLMVDQNRTPYQECANIDVVAQENTWILPRKGAQETDMAAVMLVSSNAEVPCMEMHREFMVELDSVPVREKNSQSCDVRSTINNVLREIGLKNLSRANLEILRALVRMVFSVVQL